jgi:hypothetical protein
MADAEEKVMRQLPPRELARRVRTGVAQILRRRKVLVVQNVPQNTRKVNELLNPLRALKRAEPRR